LLFDAGCDTINYNKQNKEDEMVAYKISTLKNLGRTYVLETEDTFRVWYCSAELVAIDYNQGTVKLDVDGYYTAIICKRLNQIFETLGYDVKVNRVKGYYVVRNSENDIIAKFDNTAKINLEEMTTKKCG
jgi:hypothetical protein